VSPRRARRRDESPAPLRDQVGPGRLEEWRGRDWVVRPVTGQVDRVYRCPGCDQEIRPGTPHVVVWPDGESGVEDRRHWHTSCWANRDRRGPVVQRTRNAPRHG
jgi:hypothetical protein